MTIQFANRATTLLASSISDTDTLLAVSSGTGAKFPALSEEGQWFPVVVTDAGGGYEIMRATARSGDVLTVQRAQEGTIARAFTAGARVDLRVTAAALFAILAEATENKSEVEGASVTAALNTLLVQKLDASSFDATAQLRTGAVQFTLDDTPWPGWLMFNDGTFGNAASGADYANANAQGLFNILYKYPDANAPLLTSGGIATTRSAQGSAAAAWAAGCRMSLTRALGRVIGIAGAGAGLTARSLGEFTGAESETLTQAKLPNITLATTIPAGQGSHSHALSGDATRLAGQNYLQTGAGGYVGGHTLTVQPATLPAMNGTTQLGGSGELLSRMQPTLFLNAMVKL